MKILNCYSSKAIKKKWSKQTENVRKPILLFCVWLQLWRIYICMLVICLFMFENRREKNKDVKSMKKYTICALVLYKWKFRLNCEIHTSWNDLNICFSSSNTSKSEILNLILRKQKIVLIFSLVCVCANLRIQSALSNIVKNIFLLTIFGCCLGNVRKSLCKLKLFH